MFYRLKIFIKLLIFFIFRFTYDIRIWKSILEYYRSYISKKNFIDTISIDKIID